MNKIKFKSLCEKQYIILDGATGTELMKKGMPAGVCPELWMLENPSAIVEIQKEYIKAGSNIVLAPTFTANRIKLGEYGLENRQEEIIMELVSQSKKAVEGTDVLVAGDISMVGKQLYPMGDLALEELIDVYKEQINYLVKAGVDLLIVETMMSLAEMRAALIAAKESCDLPVICSMTFEEDGRTLFGTDAKTASVVLESLGADVIGINCSTGPSKLKPFIEDMLNTVSIPVMAKPNAGLPKSDGKGGVCYDMAPEEFGKEMAELIEMGVTLVGGCCGTSPLYIAELKKLVSGKVPNREYKVKTRRYLSSERKTISFGLNDGFIVIGERINPSGKKALQEELRQGKLDMVLRFAEEQEAQGATILDVNMGMSGINEKEMMLNVLWELPSVTNLPLSLDSSSIEVLETALRNYPGRALVNSVSYESEKFEKLLPIVAKYGAMFILLPLSDEGLPKSKEEKQEIIEKIYRRALELGMKKEDIIVDGLVTTIGANSKAGVEALETISYCKENGFATVCGLSNISFGMPARVHVNTAFLTLAIQAGLTMAIANPSQEMLMCGAFATDLLLNKEDAALTYIDYASNITVVENKATTKKVMDENGKEETKVDSLGKIHQAVMKGRKKEIVALVKEALTNGEEAKKILDDALLPAINQVGDLFEKKKYFLPQLIASAETMKNGIEILEPLLMSESASGNMPTVILATVEGDIHDIGKNLVGLMLKNYGFKVIDLGKDVSTETILAECVSNQADLIVLSALMTTTMQKMRDVINLAKERGIDAKIMIGGAVITEDYAEEIGADGYAKDAQEAVKVAGKLLSEKL